MTRHRHTWREIERAQYWCPACDALKLYGEIIRADD